MTSAPRVAQLKGPLVTRPENTHLLYKGMYHCTTGIYFYWNRFYYTNVAKYQTHQFMLTIDVFQKGLGPNYVICMDLSCWNKTDTTGGCAGSAFQTASFLFRNIFWRSSLKFKEGFEPDLERNKLVTTTTSSSTSTKGGKLFYNLIFSPLIVSKGITLDHTDSVCLSFSLSLSCYLTVK